eukprot:CAMPEP_0116145152 /NCGR_PEP_ID=MMETSP0329-20121206/16420_1 /TAXON_ID=697910 /ORGANISM="Pseudo-nitzschia arenysensis, Strain B593" /LENGTH=249 /DNA_ID=CAMNT_0003640697 /DNA_START=66 /DNA_END=815 /DNA_ORIENTATION=-
MKIFTLVALNLAAAQSALAFQAVQPQTSASSTSLYMSSHHTSSDPNALGENRGSEQILSALGSLEGPSMTYGHYAALEGKTPTEIKGYDNFDNFKAAIDQVGLSKTLRGIGPFTVFAPTNSALDAFDGVLSEEVILTHIIPKDLYSDELVGEFETMSGHKVTAKYEFRKIYVDEALIGQLDNHSGGTPYPTNVVCENGVIHGINTVLTPGWSRSTMDSQGVQGLALQSHLNQNVLKDRGSLPDDATSAH